MPATYPPGLPFFALQDSIERGGADAVIRTQMSTGPAKVRRRFTAAPKRYRADIPSLTVAQLATFETFFEDTIAMGALSFTAKDPIDAQTKTFRFVGSYSVRRIGSRVRVSAELEILP